MSFNIQGSIICNGNIMSCAQLEQTANAIISQLKMHINKDCVIGIALPRTQLLIAAIIAVLNIDVPFVPIDVGFPKDRLNQIIKDANITMVITTHEIDVNWNDINKIFVDNIELAASYESIKLNNNNDLMYILFTSGSTGKPKGVEVTKAAFSNFVDGISEIIDFKTGKRITCFTTVAFDIFFLESIMALYKGLTVVLANEDEQRNPKLMAKLIYDNDVDMIQMTPSRMQLLLNHDKDLFCLKNVKEIMIGGEPFPLNLLRTLQEKTTAKIYNMYGPTETTIWSAVSDLTNKKNIDIGRPIMNTQIYIVDENLNILPNGQTGEICIAGKGLAKGYTGRKDLTAERFIHLTQTPDIKVYRTGDIGRYLPDGNIEYLGRTDNQVKIRGHRIELEEIEVYLNQIDDIKHSVVIPLETSETDKILAAFYTSDFRIDPKNITDYLSSKLPSYMVPAVFKHVKDFIYTANGKIDRKRVVECIEIQDDQTKIQGNTSDEMTGIQKKILEVIVSNVKDINLDGISLNTDISRIGIDSVTFITIAVALESAFDFEFDDEMLVITKFSTVQSMIEYIESKTIIHCENG